MAGAVWRLFNPQTSTELVSPEAQHLMAFVESLPSEQRKVWQIKQDGEIEWKCATDAVPLGPGQGTRLRPLSLAPAQDERRRHPRAPLRCRIQLSNGSLAVEVQSKNISLGGMLLDRPVPASLKNQWCHVMLSTPHLGLAIRLKARIIHEERGPGRLAFSEGDGRFLARLAQWIQGYIEVAPVPLRRAA